MAARARHLRLVRADEPVRPTVVRMGPRPIVSRYHGVCRACGIPYAPGDPLLWRQGTGATHATGACAAWWDGGGAA